MVLQSTLRSTTMLIGVALISSLGAPAFAQAQAQTAPTLRTANEADVIIVTARKREERLQDVPLAVTAFTAAAFERQQIVGLEDLHLGTPNLTIVRNTTTSNGAQVYIRGIGQDDSTFNSEPGVGIYIDGVPLGKQNGAMLDLIEFERIEILRGPQGSLYGRNSTGGAIKFVTRRPDLNGFRGVADATVGSFNHADFRGSVSIPLIDGKLAIKLDAISRSEDGFVTDQTLNENINNIDRQSLRAALLYRPTDRLSFYFTADTTADGSNINVPTPTRLIAGRTGLNADDYAPRFGSQRIVDRSIPNIQDFTGGGVSAEVSYDFGFATLTATTGIRGFENQLAGDLDGARDVFLDFIQDLEQRQVSQELQLTSNSDGALKWVLGVFAFDEKVTQGAQNTFAGVNNDNTQRATSAAIYGEVNYKFTDRLSLSVGGRYTEDEKRMIGIAYERLPQPAGQFARLDGARRFDYNRKVNFDNFSPRVVVDFKILPDVLVYASYAEGYKAGVFSTGRPTSLAAALGVIPAETVVTSEIGLKSSWFNRRLTANLAYYDSNYEQLQLSTLANGVFFVLSADAGISGFEGEFSLRPFAGLTLNANFGTFDAAFKGRPLNPATGLPFAGIPENAKLKQTPEFSYKIGGEYVFDMGSGRIGLGGNYAYNDKIFRNNGNTISIQTQAVGVLDAQIFYETEDKDWRVTLAGQNLTDEVYWLTGVNVAGAAPGALVNASRFYAAPTTWSLTLKHSF
jgi:iron complex outermembrane recepter protein